MCILCVIQKWSRKVATMLPWLVLPLIGLWALSQLLPPAFRFEITSPRLACVFVLLVTLFWYEVLMPQLSSWRVRRNARLRERKRFEAIEMQQMRKTATRRCRNCLNPYRDQNPCGGKFMCTYCGHISKRPVLDLPVPPGMGIANTGIIKGLVGKGGEIFNGKGWSDNSWTCGQDWLENGNCVGGSFAGNSTHWHKSGGGFYGGEELCMAEKSYFGVVTFGCKLLGSFLLTIRWLWRRMFRISSSMEDDLSDARRGMSKRGENGTELHESRSDKARRKAEEKRQARLEKEILEEEERKQREEVARLVEERRRLRDEKTEAEKDRGRGTTPVREKDGKKEAEMKRQGRRKEKDKGSSKSNSDVEEIEKKVGKESDRKRELEKKTESDRRESVRNVAGNNYTKVNAGTRYLDRMRGSFISSSKAFGGRNFFGRGGNSSTIAPKENKSSGFVEHADTLNRRELHKHAVHPLPLDPQPMTTPKKSWQQLFTRPSTAPLNSNSNVVTRPCQIFQGEIQSPKSSSQPLSTQSFESSVNFGLPSPFSLSNLASGSTVISSGFPSLHEYKYPCVGEMPRELLPEEPEHFEDPCYVPDPVSLLGPVSESLDNFQLDAGPGFVRGMSLEKPRNLKNVIAPSELSRPSPIESPLSRLKMADDKFSGSNSKAHDMHTSPLSDSKSPNEHGTWQMWNSSPLCQDGLGLVGGLASWLLPLENNTSNKESFLHPSSKKYRESLLTKEEEVFTTTSFPQEGFLRNSQNGGTFASPVHNATDHDPWERAFYPRSSGSEINFTFIPQVDTTKNEIVYGIGSPRRSVSSHPFVLPPPTCWSKKEQGAQVQKEEVVANPPIVKPHIGGLYFTPDVQSLWSYD